jgi:hypothetical protein
MRRGIVFLPGEPEPLDANRRFLVRLPIDSSDDLTAHVVCLSARPTNPCVRLGTKSRSESEYLPANPSRAVVKATPRSRKDDRLSIVFA